MQTDLQTLKEMLEYRRPAYSHTERLFSARFIAPTGAQQDSEGNWVKEIGQNPRTLWSSHTDTVHYAQHMQSVVAEGPWLRLPSRGSKKSTCLGADCTAGVWIMLEMIKANIPGLYVFHAAEEIGGCGSSFLARSPDFFNGIDFAIAFDRRGKDSIITHQFGECCSSIFAWALSDMLGMGHKPDATGIFTDTANYTAIVPECTNISVGYEGAHTKNEVLDYNYLFRLRDAVIEHYEEGALEPHRDPTLYADDYADYFGPYGDWSGWEAPKPKTVAGGMVWMEGTGADGQKYGYWKECPTNLPVIYNPTSNVLTFPQEQPPFANADCDYEGFEDVEDMWLRKGM